MTQFLRAVSESRMENALALAQTILKFEPQNGIILDYQATLAQFINNTRELGSARGGDSDDNGDDETSSSEGSTAETSAGPGDGESGVSTEEASSDETPEDDGGREAMAGAFSEDARGGLTEAALNDDKELQHLGGVLRQLREARAAESREVASLWNEEKFAASQREVEQVLWQFLPDEAKQVAEKRAEEDAPGNHRQSRTHHVELLDHMASRTSFVPKI
ncbi:unnamed protein product [Hapterophycus canaliculatus]